MKKLLPVFFTFIFLLLFLFSSQTYAQTPVTPAPTSSTVTESGTAPAAVAPAGGGCPDGSWCQDAEVTFVGKTASRAGSLLDWSLQNYQWYGAPNNWGTPGTPGYESSVQGNPIEDFWVEIRNLVYAFLLLIVLISAFIFMITRGKSVTIRKFIPRFLLVVVLITFSFTIIQNLYWVIDIIQGWFLRSNPPIPCTATAGCISQKDLLYVGFDYQDFIGYRLAGIASDESAFISLLLIKLTAITYYVMVGILLIRKIILWFFIIISPIFPLLLLYAPIRNTGKIWIGEFFRWLLYAPIFAIFLSGLVVMWRKFIPLGFTFAAINTASTASSGQYPYLTSISILLGGPGQQVALGNSVNYTDTFALYLVALLMLWVVIILPWLLLQIFLDYWHSFSFSDNQMIKQLMTTGSSFVNRPFSPNGTPPPPYSPTGAGLAKILPFGNAMTIPTTPAKAGIGKTMQDISAIRNVASDTEILHLANLSVPTMTDIARFETATLSASSPQKQQVSQMNASLQKIANPQMSSSPVERRQFSNAQSRLAQEAQKGNPLAASILSASKTVSNVSTQQQASSIQNMLQQITNPSSAGPQRQAQIEKVREQVLQAAQSGDPLAKSLAASITSGKAVDASVSQRILSAKETGSSLANVILQAANVTVVGQPAMLPQSNRIQSVSLDDYETVKNMWKENYQKLEPPKTADGMSTSRREWVKKEIDKMTQTINLLLSSDPRNIAKGMEAVNNILPFLLIGGFSQSEVVAYLKAKLEAAKATATELSQKEDEEETLMETKAKKTEEQKTMTTNAEESMENPVKEQDLPDPLKNDTK